MNVNSNTMTIGDLAVLMFEDGNGPDEVIALSAEYAAAIAHTRASQSAIDKVERFARRMLNDAEAGRLTELGEGVLHGA